ncbi:MAG TPA: HyaD/HybD family hydrogenase maturation endopeptidase [Gemmatimonadales bacterium]|nr:HyaD/HybD family hydrogenase maturation endopeptidase [Gemmatimonadales bacterium]
MTDVGTVVIGLGNPLMGDDGIGLALLARLTEGWEVEPAATLVDGGTWGMNLLPTIEDAGRLILLDAINVGAAPGTVVELARHQIPRFLATKISPHQVDLRDVLAVAELRRTLPEDTIAIGLQPAVVALSEMLTPVVQDRVDEAVAAVVGALELRGHRCIRREPAHA